MRTIFQKKFPKTVFGNVDGKGEKMEGKASYLKKSVGEHIFDICNILFFALLSFSFVYPFLNIVVISFNDPVDAMRGGIYFWPRVFSLENYKEVLSNPKIYTGYGVTIARTVIGSLTHVFCTAMFAYGLSRKRLMFRKTYTVLCVITMFFSGGMIPSYLLMRNLHLLNSFWGVYIIPGLIGVWDAMIFKTFYGGIPDALEEAAKIDGSSDFGVFFKIIFPLAKPCIAAIILFCGVGHWNSWFDAYIYMTDEKLMPLQTILMQIINQSAATQGTNVETATAILSVDGKKSTVTPESIRYATMVVATGPIILIYPFMQKYFEKGVMIGSVKG